MSTENIKASKIHAITGWNHSKQLFIARLDETGSYAYFGGINLWGQFTSLGITSKAIFACYTA